MTDHEKSTQIGRQLLLGAVLATLPLSACVMPVSPEEQSAYSQVVASRNVSEANDFLRRYPASPLTRQLLVTLPPATLKRLSRSAVQGVAPQILASLPPDTQAMLGLRRAAMTPPAAPRPIGKVYDG